MLAFATAFDEIPEPVNVDIARALTQLGFAMPLIFGLLGAKAMIVVASFGMLTARLPGRWLGWAGLAVAALLLLWVATTAVLPWPSAAGKSEAGTAGARVPPQ